jgi:hypothetical protein
MFPFQHFLLNMATEVINGQVPETVAGGDIAPKKPVNKKLTVEKIYQKKSQLEHILLRPDTYIGKQLTVCYMCYKLNRSVGLTISRELSGHTCGKPSFRLVLISLMIFSALTELNCILVTSLES